MINISNRLKTVAEFVLDDKNSLGVIDVGCDHALLDIYLLENNYNLKIIASDINNGPLEKAKENITKYSLLNKIKLKLADGISQIEKNIDTIVISGMGMDTIVDILEKDKDKLNNVSKLVISSNNKFPILREKIISYGFTIEKEKIIFEDGKFYVIIKFIKGISHYSPKELYFGPFLLQNKDEIFYKYFNYLKEEKISILDNIPISYIDKRKKLEKEIKVLTIEINS